MVKRGGKNPPRLPHPPAALAPGIATLPGATLPPQKNQRSEATPAAIAVGVGDFFIKTFVTFFRFFCNLCGIENINFTAKNSSKVDLLVLSESHEKTL